MPTHFFTGNTGIYVYFMADHEGSSIPNYFQLSLPFVNTNELGLQDLSLGSQWLQSKFVPIKSEEMMLAAVEKDIFKGTGHVHSLTFHESQKRRWGIYLLEASRLLQEVHQSVRQKAVEKRLFPKVVPHPRIPTKPWRCQHRYPAALGGPSVCWAGEGKTAAGFSCRQVIQSQLMTEILQGDSRRPRSTHKVLMISWAL